MNFKTYVRGKPVVVNIDANGKVQSVRWFYPHNFAGLDILPTLSDAERKELDESALEKHRWLP